MNNVPKIDYYLSLPYRIEIVPIPQNLGGGYEAFIPQLGRSTVTGCGETPEEALHSLSEVKETVFTIWIEQNTPIPLPESEPVSLSA
jgi:predicted RNase H-like HicB family nuclease